MEPHPRFPPSPRNAHGEERLYQNEYAHNPPIDLLRKKRTEVVENPWFSRDYLDPARQSITNAVQVFFADGTATKRVEVAHPLGHVRRRAEGLPRLEQKSQANLAARLPAERREVILALFHDPPRLEAMPVDQFMGLSVVEPE